MSWQDWLGGGLGLGGALFNQNQNRQTSNQYYGMGQPYRERLAAISADPNLYYNSPEAQALAGASDRRYSASVGNPAGSGTAQAGALEAMLRGYGAERDRLFNYGGGAYFNRAAPGARQGQMGANMGIFSALGPLAGLLGGMGGGSGSGGGIGGDGGTSGGWPGFDSFDPESLGGDYYG